MQYREYDGIEVSGRSVVGFLNGFAAFRALASKYLLREGVGQADGEGFVVVAAEHWYPLPGYLRAFRAISLEVSDSIVEALGRAVMQNVYWPPEANTLDGMVRHIDVGYHMHHRHNGQPLFDPRTNVMHEGIGHYRGMQLAPNLFEVRCENPYPCAFDRGLLEGALRRLGRMRGSYEIIHESTAPCRAQGGKSCTLRIRTSTLR
jgi:hypothetical protein